MDGDTDDVPLMIPTNAARRQALDRPEPKFGHSAKFGSDPVKHHDFSAVNHIAQGKRIPRLLLPHVADHVDTTAQALRLWEVLRAAGLPAESFGALDTDHVRLDVDLDLPDDPRDTCLVRLHGRRTAEVIRACRRQLPGRPAGPRSPRADPALARASVLLRQY